jgi:hypothetical protein
VNNHDIVLFNDSFFALMESAELLNLDLSDVPITWDAGFDSQVNHQTIIGQGLVPIIKPNARNIKESKKLEVLFKRSDDQEHIYKERYKVERFFAWEDTYRRLVTRYERLQSIHIGFKYLAYSMINLRSIVGKVR